MAAQTGPLSCLLVGLMLFWGGGCQRWSVAPQDRVKPAVGEAAAATNPPDGGVVRLAIADYVDDAVCADCHRDIYDSYQQVAMAKSFYDFDAGNTIESFRENRFHHSLSGNHYEMTVVDGKLQMTRYRLREDGAKIRVHTQSADYVVGSGNHVRTYLYRNQAGELFQMPVVWYSQENRWGMAPGYDTPDHEDFDRPITRQCMSCHNAYPVLESGSDRFGMPHVFPRDLPQGIGCQRCHGPGSEHVRVCEKAGPESEEQRQQIRNSIVNPSHLSPQLQDDVCNQCHLQPMSQRTSFLRHFGKGDFEYRPGQSLDEYMLYFEPDRDNQFADHFEINHHPYRLHQSACYLQTPGGIRCTDCHDPHVKIAKPDQAAFYRAKCLTCHDADDCLDETCGQHPESDCIHCHMPQRRTTDVVHVTMTDHRIGRFAHRRKLTEPLQEIDVPLSLPIRPYVSSNRARPPDDVDIRQYELLARALDGDDSATPPLRRQMTEKRRLPLELAMQLGLQLLQNEEFEQAEATLSLWDQDFPHLPILQTNLNISLLGQGKNKTAIEGFLQAVADDPNHVAAWYHLGVAQSRIGQSAEAIASLKTAIRLRPSYGRARSKLGSIYAMLDRLDEAAQQFESAVCINANDVESCRKLSSVYRRQNRWQDAIGCIQDTLLFSRDDSNSALRKELTMLLLDSRNSGNRNPELALASANQMFASSQEMDHVILRTMALLENKQAVEAIDFVGARIRDDERKAEAGLLLAIGQLMVGSDAAAWQNFRAAKAVIGRDPDRIGRIVLEYAGRQFAGEQPGNQD